MLSNSNPWLNKVHRHSFVRFGILLSALLLSSNCTKPRHFIFDKFDILIMLFLPCHLPIPTVMYPRKAYVCYCWPRRIPWKVLYLKNFWHQWECAIFAGWRWKEAYGWEARRHDLHSGRSSAMVFVYTTGPTGTSFTAVTKKKMSERWRVARWRAFIDMYLLIIIQRTGIL